MRFRYLKETIENGSGIGWDVPRIFRKSYVGIFASIRWVLGNLRGYAVMAVLLIFISSIVQPIWIVYANDVIGLSAYDWGVILLVSGVVKTVVSMAVGASWTGSGRRSACW